jgi:hypothetical protein
MTREHHLVFDCGDIQALLVECDKCKAVLSLRLDGIVRPPSACPNCNDDWGATPPSKHPAKTLADAIRDVRRFEQDQPRFRVRLEFVDVKPDA